MLNNLLAAFSGVAGAKNSVDSKAGLNLLSPVILLIVGVLILILLRRYFL